MKHILYLTALISILSSCNAADDDNAPVTPAISYEETNYFFHDTSLYTEGLLVHNGQLFESTGSPDTFRKSLIGINDLKTGRFEKKTVFANKRLFGEGITFFKDRLYQLTYKTQRGFIYDANSFRLLDSFTYRNKEGWGLTTDGYHLIMSDGTDTLTYLDPATLKPVKTLPVHENGFKRDSLNELEYIKGHIYANIWLTNNIVKINPANGQIVGRLDISPLAFKASMKNPDCGEPNGIAWDSTTGHLYITGKLWPYIFQLKMP
ncbi:glutaminyl-peptide cyclotransferase [Longitalea luteola]|uniref:glutaminyl-peptide cyclotransferase n=1 Tax=Longitalea luteola TaxID=2812563 RepID=UPI001A97BD7A|nr:glutaminyl-peptide cyclotransferase [Longitalea luteola]